MSDNVTASIGSQDGAVFATDDVNSVQYPRTKISHGVDGVAGDVTPSNPLPMIDWSALELMTKILVELRTMNELLIMGLSINADLDNLRNDPSKVN